MTLQFLALAQLCNSAIKDTIKRKQVVKMMHNMYMIEHPLTLCPILFNPLVSFSITMNRSDQMGVDICIEYKLEGKTAGIRIHKKRQSYLNFNIDSALIHSTDESNYMPLINNDKVGSIPISFFTVLLFIRKLPHNIAKVISDYYFNLNNITHYDNQTTPLYYNIVSSNKWSSVCDIAYTLRNMVLQHNKYNLNFICELYKYNLPRDGNAVDNENSIICNILRLRELSISKHRC